MRKIVFLAGVAIPILVGSYFVASLFRYEPIPGPASYDWAINSTFVQVWDRWKGRACYTFRPETSNVGGIACTREEIAALLARRQSVDGEAQTRKTVRAREEERFAKIAGGPRIGGAAAVVELRRGGFSEAEIAEYVKKIRGKMLHAGAPKKLVNDYFGGDPYGPSAGNPAEGTSTN